jgi:uncharacterized protein YbjT (DUF2867 family)
MRIAIVGGTGLLGRQVTAELRERGHEVRVSIVGCDRVSLGYYRVKTEQDGVVAGGPLPWTIVRATQFDEFVAGMLGAAARYRVVPVPGKVGRALRDGSLTTGSPDVRGSLTFAAWVRSRPKSETAARA